jgi:hypothetical protein
LRVRARREICSPTGFSSSIRSHTVLTTIRIGVPRIRPTAPQSQPKASTPMKTANGLMRLARPVHHGVTTLPTTPWIANAAKPRSSALSTLSNWMKPNNAEAPPRTIAPAYGTRLVTAATTPHTGALARPMAKKARPVAMPTMTLVASWTSR